MGRGFFRCALWKSAHCATIIPPFLPFIVIPLLQNLRKFLLLFVILAAMANIVVAFAPPITSRLVAVGVSTEAITCQIVRCPDFVPSDAHVPQIVTVPAGIDRPTLSMRAIAAEVTVCDGATALMAGFTRDDVKTVNGNVPMLGDISVFGRPSRSIGGTRCKCNLLNFVTANLVSSCGSLSPQKCRYGNVNSLFHNPTIIGASGSSNRPVGAIIEA